MVKDATLKLKLEWKLSGRPDEERQYKMTSEVMSVPLSYQKPSLREDILHPGDGCSGRTSMACASNLRVSRLKY